MVSIVLGCLLRNSIRLPVAVWLAWLVAGCASTAPVPSFPAFVQADELPDIFLADLPGVRAKRFAGDPKTRRSSSRLDLPRDWSFSTGGFPDKSVEIYVLTGNVKLGEFTLRPGGYAYLPDGASGVPISTDAGARILYFLDDANSAAVIRTPIISDRELIPWTPLSADPGDVGLMIKTLREDPGSGATTYLLRIEPAATRPWQSHSVLEEGYLLEGEYRHSECVNGTASTEQYLPGGYYYRPADAVSGGPESQAVAPSVWLVRRFAPGQRSIHDACTEQAGGMPTS